MQDPAIFQPMKPQFPEQEQLKCPRCDSSNTKFCYYNNYNLSQPRHFCKNCRRYWTKGGTLRNIPVGGGTRKNTRRPSSSSSKRSSSSSSSSSSPSLAASSTPIITTNSVASTSLGMQKSGIFGSVVEQDSRMLDIGGSFSSLLASNGQFGSVFEELNPSGPGAKMVQMGETRENLNSCLDLDMGSGRNLGLEVQGSNGSENFLGMQNGDSSCWIGGGGNGWPDLAIYTTPETLVVKKRSMNDSSS